MIPVSHNSLLVFQSDLLPTTGPELEFLEDCLFQLNTWHDTDLQVKKCDAYIEISWSIFNVPCYWSKNEVDNNVVTNLHFLKTFTCEILIIIFNFYFDMAKLLFQSLASFKCLEQSFFYPLMLEGETKNYKLVPAYIWISQYTSNLI